jgi:hypothetical protein
MKDNYFIYIIHILIILLPSTDISYFLLITFIFSLFP